MTHLVDEHVNRDLVDARLMALAPLQRRERAATAAAIAYDTIHAAHGCIGSARAQAATISALQQTVGNAAVARAIQRASLSAPDIRYHRDRYLGSVYDDAREGVLASTEACEYCQARPPTTVDHLISVYDADAVVGAGMMTRDEARSQVNAPGNLLAVCGPCNSSKRDRQAGNAPGTWRPPNPSAKAIDLMANLGTWRDVEG